MFAEYELQSNPLGYDVSVFNSAQSVTPLFTEFSGNLCARIVDQDKGRLEVAPCFLIPAFAGPYWVLAYNEEEGYALISGGPPKIATESACRTGTGINDSGLWIFTRQQQRDEALVQKVRGIASDLGFDLSVLNDVDQTDCLPASSKVEAPVQAPVRQALDYHAILKIHKEANRNRGFDITQCMADVTNSASYIVRAILKIRSASSACSDPRACAVNIVNIISSFAWISQFTALAVSDCAVLAEQKALCTADIFVAWMTAQNILPCE